MMSFPSIPNIEGHIAIDLHHDSGRVTAARIASGRPVGLSRAFAGKTATDVLKTIPMLFTLCSVAHTVASVEAYEDATRLMPSHAARTARRIAVLAETAREHALRIALDWPRFIGEAPEKEPLPRVMAQVPAVRRAVSVSGDPFLAGAQTPPLGDAFNASIIAIEELAGTVVFGEPLGEWRARSSMASLIEWSGCGATVAARFIQRIIVLGWQSIGAGETRFLPELDKETLAVRLDVEAPEQFLAAPLWDGQPHETTPLSRQRNAPLMRAVLEAYGPGLLARAIARLVELANIPEDMRALTAAAPDHVAPHLTQGTGLAQVEAARGRLVHYIRLAAPDRVAHYAILAPTEWNFHPQGAAIRAFEAINSSHAQELRDMAEMLINVIDPCVAHELRLH